MPDKDPAPQEYLWRMCEQNIEQARHHEGQRATVATALIAVSGALIGLITFDQRISPSDLSLAVFLIITSLFGLFFQAKQYERFDLHMERARTYRDALDASLPGAPIKKLKLEADRRNAKKHPFLEPLRLYRFWALLYVLIALIGVGLSVAAIGVPFAAWLEPRVPLP